MLPIFKGNVTTCEDKNIWEESTFKVNKCPSTQELSFAMYLYVWIDGVLSKFTVGATADGGNSSKKLSWIRNHHKHGMYHYSLMILASTISDDPWRLCRSPMTHLHRWRSLVWFAILARSWSHGPITDMLNEQIAFFTVCHWYLKYIVVGANILKFCFTSIQATLKSEVFCPSN